ncbi:MAG: hypothetical protein IBJ10_04490 [Phycisphaerales bacterium]|nr:hypothetical protein [Phycisphaerales bacterium]
MRLMLVVLLSAVFGAALLAREPEVRAPQAVKPLNTVCPVEGGELDPVGATEEYQGWTIGFCCTMCAAKWRSMNEDVKDEFVARFAPAGPINAMCPIGKEPVALDVPVFMYKGQPIGVCCAGCEKQFLAWPEADRDAFVKQHTDLPFMNDTCPLADDPIMNDENPSVVFLSARIAFCCPHCMTKWNAMTNGARVEMLEKLMAAPAAE